VAQDIALSLAQPALKQFIAMGSASLVSVKLPTGLVIAVEGSPKFMPYNDNTAPPEVGPLELRTAVTTGASNVKACGRFPETESVLTATGCIGPDPADDDRQTSCVFEIQALVYSTTPAPFLSPPTGTMQLRSTPLTSGALDANAATLALLPKFVP
jgi:hypothetical protein